MPERRGASRGDAEVAGGRIQVVCLVLGCQLVFGLAAHARKAAQIGARQGQPSFGGRVTMLASARRLVRRNPLQFFQVRRELAQVMSYGDGTVDSIDVVAQSGGGNIVEYSAQPRYAYTTSGTFEVIGRLVTTDGSRADTVMWRSPPEPARGPGPNQPKAF